jgi:hypothetical protein
MAAKFITSARAAAAKRETVSSVDDPALFDGRPALREFMTLVDLGEGEVREVSPLMITIREEGVAVGIKETDEGRWLWRTGESLQDALDALEEALVDPKANWSKPAAQGPRRGRKR